MSKLSLSVEKAAKAAKASNAITLWAGDAVMANVVCDPVSMWLPESLSVEEWREVGKRLAAVERAVMWWIGDWWAFGQHKYGERASFAGERFKTFHNAGTVARAIQSARRRALLSFSHHAVVAPLQPEEQDYWLRRAEEEAWDRNTLRREIRRARAVGRLTADLPPGQFNVILADPPWRYDFVETDSRAIENQYPTLSVEDICNYHDDAGRAIGSAIATDALLFLWSTSPKLTEALRVIEAWGFEYRTQAVWVKDRIGMGYYVREQHESLLIAKRGAMPPPPDDSDRQSSVIQAPRGTHSRKPDEAYELIESMYPTGRWLECFARRGRPGWASFGNQLEEAA